MLNHTQIICLMIIMSVAGLTAWLFAWRSWGAPVPLDDESDNAPQAGPYVNYASYRGYWD